MEPDEIVIKNDQQKLFDLVNHEGWHLARKRIVEKVLELQNVAEYVDLIKAGNATNLLKEMKANKRAAEILYSWLTDIEGTSQQKTEMQTSAKTWITTFE